MRGLGLGRSAHGLDLGVALGHLRVHLVAHAVDGGAQLRDFIGPARLARLHRVGDRRGLTFKLCAQGIDRRLKLPVHTLQLDAFIVRQILPHCQHQSPP